MYRIYYAGGRKIIGALIANFLPLLQREKHATVLLLFTSFCSFEHCLGQLAEGLGVFAEYFEGGDGIGSDFFGKVF